MILELGENSMTKVKSFNKEDFRDALVSVVGGDENHVHELGYFAGELRFRYVINEFDGGKQVAIYINSSIMKSTGLSSPSGDNSIRAWIANQEGKPLGSKTQKWVTRTEGWEQRLDKMMGELIEMAVRIEVCPTCNKLQGVFIAKTSKNKGRKFLKCPDGCKFIWMDGIEAPKCPKCAGDMRMRDGKYGEFWGCSRYPTCKGTRNVSYDNVTAEFPKKDLAPDEVGDFMKNARSKKSGFTPSKYQKAIFDWVQTSKEGQHLVVRALAGSGKTTTGLEMLKYTRGLDVLFVAFNKAIQMELQNRAPSHVKVLTYHALGYKACRDAYELTKDSVDQNKIYNILNGLLDRHRYKHLFSTIRKITSLVKANLSGTSDDELSAICDHYAIELNGDIEVIFEAVRHTIVKCAEQTNIVDFDDMCWLPIYHDLPMKQYDVVFIDEAQDTNKNQIALALKSIKDTGRIIAVGDDYQSMYGFRGADVDAIPRLIESLDADELPLSITYRCPTSHVDLVNKKFPYIPMQAWEEKDEGEIIYWSMERALVAWKSSDMVLCRTNAPLVRPCFDLIRRGIKATIRGRDIGKGLINIIRKMKANDVSDLIIKLTDYRNKEVEKLQKAEKNSQANALEDKVDTIIALLDNTSTITELEHKIESVFSDKVEGVVFSTVHKAKGLESTHVSILRSDLMPHPMAEKPWEKEQENNILYVALTRSLETLVFVN